MTISSSGNSITAACTGSQQAFSFNFVGVAAADISVSVISPSGVITALTSSQYTIALNAAVNNQLWGTGGTVTTGSVYSTGTSISILRTLPITQTTSVQNQGNYYAQVTEQALDTLCMEIQQVNGIAQNAIQIPTTDTGINTILPAAAARAGQYVAFDSAGNVITTVGAAAGTLISSVMQPVVTAGTLASARTAMGVAASGANTDITSLSSPALGSATAVTLGGSDNSTHVATTAQVQAAISASATTGATTPPQVRLSLSSSAPIQPSDITGATTIYALPYLGNFIPVWNGSTFVYKSFSGASLVLSTSNHTAGGVYDVYASIQGGNATLSAMYWGGTGARSTTAAGKTQTGNSSITTQSGILVNNAAISNVDSFNNATGFPIPQFQGTLLGSFYTTAAGQTAVTMKPSAISGGTNNIIGLCNAYNRVRISSMCEDSASWTYGAASWRPFHSSNSNRVSYVDSLQQISVRTNANNYYTSASANYQIGAVLDSTSSTPLSIAASTVGGAIPSSNESFAPQLGLHFIQAMEFAGASTNQIANATNSSAVLIVDTEY